MHNRYQFEVPEEKKVRVIIDSDVAGEADDPFAIAHALMSPKLLVKAVVAEHCVYPDSMQKSYEAMERLADAMDVKVNILHGEEFPLDENRELSEGVQFIIEEARKEDERPLFLLCMGPLSNPARALSAAPDIAKRLTVVTIGGHGYEQMRDFREANFGGDIKAANTVLGSGVNLWQIPVCSYGRIRTGLAELQNKVAGCGKAGKYLFEQMINYNMTEAAWWTPGESWSLGDSPAVAVVLDPDCGSYTMLPSRYVNEDTSYSAHLTGHVIRVYHTVNARFVLEDFFAKLKLCCDSSC